MECLGDSLGEEEFALREVNEDLLEELGESEGADCGGWFEVVGHVLTDDVGSLAKVLDPIALVELYDQRLFQSSQSCSRKQTVPLKHSDINKETAEQSGRRGNQQGMAAKTLPKKKKEN